MNHDLASPFLRPFLPHWLIERIGTPALQPGLVHRCNATILYADLSGFTRLTATFAGLPDGAERLHDSLTRFFDVLIDTIIAHGGDVAAIAGDALTAWWPDRNDIEVARRCGEAMVEALNELPAISTPQGPFRLDLRIGVSAGLTYVVLAGMPSHGLHLVICGPAMDAATKAEQLAAPGTIHVDEAPHLGEEGDVITVAALEPVSTLSWEHFLPPTFAERLRYHDLVAEYRRCVPAFAAFDMPGKPEELHRLVAQAQAVVLRWGGWLNEVEVGDKGAIFVMLFGAPVARGDDPSRAVGCCLELRDRELIDRAGVTVGILFVGAVGSQQRRVYTAQGDDMNLAAHLMQAAKRGEVLVSGRVRSEILGRYQTTELTQIVTKGHSDGVSVARVISGGARVGRGVALQRYLPDAVELIGRSEERQALEVAATRAADGNLSVILLEGESGIGKSYVLQNLAAKWMEQGYRGYSSECSSGGLGIPLLAWRPILTDLCGIDEGASLTIQRAQLDQAIQVLPQIDGPARLALARALCVAEDTSGDGTSVMSDPEDQNRLIELAVDLICVQLTVAPLLIVLEDVHWADDLSLQLAARLLQAPQPGRPFPLCLTLSHRPLDGSVPAPLTALRADLRTTRVTLGRLTSDQSAALIRALLGVSDVQPDLRQHVERQTEGQPLFIKEYLRVLQQHNLALIEDGVARLAPNAIAVQVSSSAQGVIQARVDRLDEPTRLTLKSAAVIGRSFPFRMLKMIHPARPNDQELLIQLATLINLKIIDLELEDPEPVYRFKYGITHEVAYTSLLFWQRRQLHATVARQYENDYATDIATGRAAMAVYDVLISHLRRAEEWRKQTRYCRVAAEQAAQQFSNAAALRYIEQAMVATNDPTERYELLLLRVMINERIGNYVNQGDDLHTMTQLADQLEDPLRQAYVYYYQLCYLLAIGRHLTLLGMSEVIEQCLLQALQRHTSGESRRQTRLLRAGYLDTRGGAYHAQGNLEQARSLHRRALVMCLDERAAGEASPHSTHRWLDSRTMAARCLNHLGQVALQQGHLDEAMSCFRQALSLARTTNNWSTETRARSGLSQVHLAQQNTKAAMSEANSALATSQAVGDRTGQAIALQQLAAISAAQEDYEEAKRRALHALTISANMRVRVLEAQILQDIAGFAAAQGMDEEAEAARQEAEHVREQWREQAVSG
ncbi:MAG: AAA family ATPase [Oscillochloris sp.]|nr:AAA family ATPase [Oscillochloris sp.]